MWRRRFSKKCLREFKKLKTLPRGFPLFGFFRKTFFFQIQLKNGAVVNIIYFLHERKDIYCTRNAYLKCVTAEAKSDGRRA